jgi:hypothetical protein
MHPKAGSNDVDEVLDIGSLGAMAPHILANVGHKTYSPLTNRKTTLMGARFGPAYLVEVVTVFVEMREQRTLAELNTAHLFVVL